jgi:hypothetical protein
MSIITSLSGKPLEKLIVPHLVRKFPYFVENAINKSVFENIFNKGHCFLNVLLNIPGQRRRLMEELTDFNLVRYKRF